jgi:HK97 family phage portal protein
MKFTERAKTAWAVLTEKGAADNSEQMTLNQLLNFLGVHKAGDAAAMSEAVYFACCKVLSESIGKLPLKIQQFTPDRGIRVAREHPYYRMLNERPNRYMTASTFWSTMELCRNHYGNAYALIDTRKTGSPQLWPIDPTAVQVWYDDAKRLDKVTDVYYRVSTREGVVILGSEEVLHFKSHNTLDGLVGISVREQLASTIQGNAKAQEYVNKLYDSGMTAKAVLQYTANMNDANVQALTRGLEAYAKGAMKDKGIENIIPVPFGVTLTPLNLKLADSQFLEIKQYTALQIASAFGVKPYQVGDYTKSSYASAEAQQLSFLIDTLLFIVKQYEEEIGYKLLTDVEEAAGYHSKFNTAVILRADQQTQINTLSAAVANFLMTPNEARERLDLPSKPGGDQLLGNGASIPVQYAGAQYTQISAGKEEEKAWMITAIAQAVALAMKTAQE